MAVISLSDVQKLHMILRTCRWDSDDDFHALVKRCALAPPEDGSYWFYLIDEDELIDKIQVKHNIERGKMEIIYKKLHPVFELWYPELLSGTSDYRLHQTLWHVFKSDNYRPNYVTMLMNCKIISVQALALYREGGFRFEKILFYDESKETYIEV